MDSKYRKGIGFVEGIFVVIAVLTLGLIAYAYLHRQDSQNTHTMKPPTSRVSNAPNIKLDASLVKTSYDTYLGLVRSGAQPSAMTMFESNATPSLAITLKHWAKEYDPILCAQNYPTSLTYGSPEVVAGNTVLIVTEHFQSSQGIKVTVDGATDKIAAIDCPAP